MPAVRKAIDYAEQKLGIEHLLVHPKLRTEGGELLLDQYGKLTNLSQSGQRALREILQRHHRRIEWDAKLPVRFFPIVSDGDGSEGETIVIDPLIALGRPIVASKGIATAAIRWRLDAGETPQDVAADYDVTIDEVREAAAYELAARCRRGTHSELERVAEEARLPDWDGQGATAISPATMGYALALLASLPAGTPAPQVTADPDGELVFEWERGAPRVFAVAVGADGTMNLAGLFGYDVVKGSFAFRGVLPAAVVDGIRRVFEGA